MARNETKEREVVDLTTLSRREAEAYTGLGYSTLRKYEGDGLTPIRVYDEDQKQEVVRYKIAELEELMGRVQPSARKKPMALVVPPEPPATNPQALQMWQLLRGMQRAHDEELARRMELELEAKHLREQVTDLRAHIKDLRQIARGK